MSHGRAVHLVAKKTNRCRISTVFALGKDHFIERKRSFGGDSGAWLGYSEILELPVEGRPSDAEAPRDLAHLPAIMVDREQDRLLLELGEARESRAPADLADSILSAFDDGD